MGRNTAGISRPPKSTRTAFIQLRKGALKNLFAGTGITGYVRRAAHLGVSTTSLWRADHGHPVGVEIIGAVRLKFPHMKYEDSFIEWEAPRVTASRTAA